MKKLLIVVDYQVDFVSGALGFEGAELLAPVIKDKIENYLKEGNDIIFTLDTHLDNYMDTMEGSKLPIPHCLKGSEGWKVVKEVDYLELGNYLKDREYEEVELCGLVSNICVLTNAVVVKASLPNARIVIDAKATDSFDKELQNKCFDVLDGIHIEVINR